jgi:hypothetical protein
MEHLDCLLERLSIKILAFSVDGDQLASPIHDSLIQLRMLEDQSPEEVDGDIVQRLLLREQV